MVHAVKKGEDFPQLVRGIGWHTLTGAFRVEPLQALMDKVPYFHRQTVVRSLTPFRSLIGRQLKRHRGLYARYLRVSNSQNCVIGYRSGAGPGPISPLPDP